MVDGQIDVDLRHADARHRTQRVRFQQFVVFRILLAVEIIIRLAADRVDAPAEHALPALQQEPVVFDRPLHHRIARPCGKRLGGHRRPFGCRRQSPVRTVALQERPDAHADCGQQCDGGKHGHHPPRPPCPRPPFQPCPHVRGVAHDVIPIHARRLCGRPSSSSAEARSSRRSCRNTTDSSWRQANQTSSGSRPVVRQDCSNRRRM